MVYDAAVEFRRDAKRPGNNQWRADAAFVHEVFEAAERSIGSMSPAVPVSGLAVPGAAAGRMLVIAAQHFSFSTGAVIKSYKEI